MTETTREYQAKISGMTCANCAARIEKKLNKMPGLEVQVNFALETARFSPRREDPNGSGPPDFAEIREKLRSMGYDGEPLEPADHPDPLATDPNESRINMREAGRLRRHLIISVLLTLPLFLTMAHHLSPGGSVSWLPAWLSNGWVQLLLSAPVQWWIGARFFKGAWQALRDGSANMDVLVALGTGAAWFYSFFQLPWPFLWSTESWAVIYDGAAHLPLYFETAAMLVTMILLGKRLEHGARGQASQALRELAGLLPETTERLISPTDGAAPNGPAKTGAKSADQWETVELSAVQPGDILRILPGGKVPVDGEILEGRASLDESMLTGESNPVVKEVGQTIYSGTIALDGTLVARARQTGAGTLLSRVAEIVRAAQGGKAPLQRIADSVAGVFVPAVVLIALVTFFVWFFMVTPGDWFPALRAGIAVLVIACPCALGLATPMSILVGSTRAARGGVLFRDPAHLERLRQTDVLVLDKTGTITAGKPKVTRYWLDTTVPDLPEIIRELAGHSHHPLARSVAAFIKESKDSTDPEHGSPDTENRVPADTRLSGIRESPGEGVEAQSKSGSLRLGSASFCLGMENGDRNANRDFLPIGAKDLLDHEAVGSRVWVSRAGIPVGLFLLEDPLKAGVPEVLTEIRAAGRAIWLFTGDNEATARRVAGLTGIQNIKAGMSPTDKADEVRTLQKQGKFVTMVGDGINDGPALALADSAVAFRSGTDIAAQAAPILLVGSDLSGLRRAFAVSAVTVSNIRQNLFWAFFYNALGIPLAAAGLLAPWVAGTAMAFSSVSVVLNALRLRRVRLP